MVVPEALWYRRRRDPVVGGAGSIRRLSIWQQAHRHRNQQSENISRKSLRRDEAEANILNRRRDIYRYRTMRKEYCGEAYCERRAGER